MTTRRRFLQVGIAGAAALFAVRALEGAVAPRAPRRVLDPASERIVAALAPVVLAGALPEEQAAREAAIASVVDAFDREVAVLDAAARDDVSQLLGLLRFAPSRFALTGLWAPLGEAPVMASRASPAENDWPLARSRVTRTVGSTTLARPFSP